jgi:hypothetical protein
MAPRFSKDLAARQQNRDTIRLLLLGARDTGMLETVSNGIAAEQKLVDEFAQLHWKREEGWTGHCVL